MPDPISNNPAPFDPSLLYEHCDSSRATCAPAPPSPPATRSVTIEPVYVMGDAGPGAQELVRRQSVPSCSPELASSFVSCPLIAGGVLTTIAASPSLIGGAAGLVGTFGLSVQCGKDVASYVDCRDAGAERLDILADCDARGGVALAGVNPNEIVCQVTR